MVDIYINIDCIY